MPRYPDAPGSAGAFDHAAAEAGVLEKWAREGTFEQSMTHREGAPHFVFYEGPPTANGKPGIHHVMARTIKDTFCRYRTMKGFRVDRKAGWDTHGLPVEIEVEKRLGLEGREQILDYGIERYNAACRASVLEYTDLWNALTRRMGYWVDLSDPYVTFENRYIESVWALLKRIHEKGLLYRGQKIQWYSPASGTVLSSHEVSLGYKEAQDPSIYTCARLRDDPTTSLLAWTTTPWTVPSNAAMAVGPAIPYVKVRLGEEFVILAEARLDAVLKGEGEVVERMFGRDLLGRRYEPMVPTFAERLGEDAAWRVVAADYVTTEDGTGIVHTAPAFGADDFATGQREGLPVLNPIEKDGRFEADFPLVGGLGFKEADRPIIRDLRERGLLFREDSYVHNYPHDWRKGTPLMQYPVDSWFVRTTAIKDRLVALNQTIGWQPEGIGTGRFGAWLDGNVDWALSRMRFWGTPLPVWLADNDPEHVEVIGSLDELRAKPNVSLPDGELDLHRPFVDAISWDAPPEIGGRMTRVPDLIDVWFDSGAMPFAQWGYRVGLDEGTEREARFRANFPADFIAEGVDQTRGWFYTLHAIAALVEDEVAYKNVVVNGLVLDADGQKMSKSVGNTVDPFATIQQHGADPVRWYLMAASPPWENLRYADRAVEETRRRFFGTLLNTYGFFATYANLDGFVYDQAARTPIRERAELDRWILARLATAIRETDAAYDVYHPTRAARAVEAFVEELSNWYVRRSRRRFWRSEDDADKRAAYETLFECLATVARLMAPLAPFTAEWLWSALGHAESVHLADFPAPDRDAADADLERRMGLARSIASAALALRNEAGINVRQPLPRLFVVAGVSGVDEADVRAIEAIVCDEVNVKAVDVIGPDSGLVEKTARPNFKVLGKKLGPQMKAAAAVIAMLDAEQITLYEREGRLDLDVDGATVTLEPGDLDVTSAGLDGRLVRQDDGLTVALDPTITDDLRAEGLAREFVNRVQNLRKGAGLDVSDRIAVAYAAEGGVADALARHAETIQSETLAVDFAPGTPDGDGWSVLDADLGGVPVRLALRKLDTETAL